MSKSYKTAMLFFALLGSVVFISGVVGSGNVKARKMRTIGNVHQPVNVNIPVLQNTEQEQPIFTPVETNSVPQPNPFLDDESEDEEEEGC